MGLRKDDPISAPKLFLPCSLYQRCMTEEITLVDIPPMQVLGIRRKGNYRVISELLGQIFEFAMRNQINIAGMPMFVLHEASREEAIEADRTGTADVEAVVPVAGPVRASGEIRAYELPGGRMARIMHQGPYEEAERSYRRVIDWITKKGLQVKGPIREVYHNNPQKVRPDEILTEILVPVG